MLRQTSTQDQREMLPFAAGESTTFQRVEEDHYQVLQQLDDGLVLWAAIDYQIPEGCGPDPAGAVTATFSDECDQVSIEAVSAIEPPQFYLALRNLGSEDDENGQFTETGAVSSGVPGQHQMSAQPGDVFSVVVVTGDGEQVVAEHSYTEPPSCGSDGGAGGQDDDSGAGGSTGPLPVTGLPAVLLVAGGLALVAGGAVLVASGRRRRIRFSAGR